MFRHFCKWIGSICGVVWRAQKFALVSRLSAAARKQFASHLPPSRGAETMHNSLAMTFPLSLLSCVLLLFFLSSFPLMLHFYWHFKGVVKIHCSEFMLRPFRRYGLLPPSVWQRQQQRWPHTPPPPTMPSWSTLLPRMDDGTVTLFSPSFSVSHHSLGRIPPPQPLCC